MTYTRSEENCLKAIFTITEQGEHGGSTTAIAAQLHTKASSVTEMVKRLSEKGLVGPSKPYHGVLLTEPGNRIATRVIRRHRLWETFLVNHLNFRWDEVHDLAEQLEHIDSDELHDRLDKFMDHPHTHGDPIPDKDGRMIDMAGALCPSPKCPRILWSI